MWSVLSVFIISYYFGIKHSIMRNGTSNLSSLQSTKKHPLQSTSEVTICLLNENIINQEEEDIDTIIQNKYNVQQRKLIIIDRSKGKIIDSRIIDVQNSSNNNFRQTLYIPLADKSNGKSHEKEEDFIYERIDDSNFLLSTQGKEKINLKSVWDQQWKQIQRVHDLFLQPILKGQTMKFQKFLQKKSIYLPIDINYRYQSNWCPIHYASMQSSIQIISRLINHPRIDINVLTDFGETPLHIAVKSNKLQNCLLLISAGVCMDKKDNDMNTALHYSSELGYKDITIELLKSGASCYVKNSQGMTARDLASQEFSNLFTPYIKTEEQDPLYRNRSNHRTMVQRMLNKNNEVQGSVVVRQQKKDRLNDGKNVQFWRKKNILKMYSFIRQNQKVENITLGSFKFYKKIGEGAFGQVYLVKKGEMVGFYALKAIRKERVFGTSLYRYIQTQKQILSLLNHPFIVKLRFAFQTETYLFLVMDYCQGGDLSKLLEKKKKFQEKYVRHYACEILLGIQALHKNNIIYRDLKPENIVLDKDGHALITDFGLSKKIDNINDLNKSFCGTPAYLPLEIINKKGHNRMADWYEFGIVIYELYTGIPPFYAETKAELYELVRKGYIKFSKNTPDLLKDLIKKLLSQNPEKRLGSEKDAESIRQHPWFADIDWQKVIQRKLQMPPIENKLKIGDPIKTKFHDTKSDKFQIPMWSFMQ